MHCALCKGVLLSDSALTLAPRVINHLEAVLLRLAVFCAARSAHINNFISHLETDSRGFRGRADRILDLAYVANGITGTLANPQTGGAQETWYEYVYSIYSFVGQTSTNKLTVVNG